MWMQGGVSDEDRLDAAGTRRVLRRTIVRLRPERRLALTASMLLIIWTGSLLAGPVLVGFAIDNGIRADNPTRLNQAVVAYIVVATVSYITYRIAILNLARAGEGFLRGLRLSVFKRLLQLSMSFYDREKAGVIVSRMTSDVDALQEMVQFGLLFFVANALLLIGVSIVLVALSWQLTLVCLVSMPLVLAASVKFQRESNRAYLAVRDRVAATLSALQEGLSGVRVVQAFAREDIEAQRFAHENRGLYDAHMRSVKVAAWYIPVIDFAGLATTGLAVGVGGWMVHRGSLSLGTVIAFVLLLSNLFEPVQQLSQLFNMLQSAGASLQKLYAVLDEEVEVDESAGAVDLPVAGAVELRGVGFQYGSGPPVLSDVDLRIEPGERLALVGPTGAGKSTLAKLIARLYDPSSGTISYDGIDLRDATLSSLRDRIVVVPQEGYLFDGTIADNLTIARPDAGDEATRQALRSIGALGWLDQLPDGLATEVRERGSRLSGGERQLVSLARAALVDPAVLVLDEATSSLDPGTETLVEHALESLMRGRTAVVIAHRLSTAKRCDRIAVVDDGRLVELGTHDELVCANGRYAGLYESWTLAGTVN